MSAKVSLPKVGVFDVVSADVSARAYDDTAFGELESLLASPAPLCVAQAEERAIRRRRSVAIFVSLCLAGLVLPNVIGGEPDQAVIQAGDHTTATSAAGHGRDMRKAQAGAEVVEGRSAAAPGTNSSGPKPAGRGISRQH